MEKRIIEIKDLYYTYPDGTHALNGINLEITKGQKLAFLGPNGSGKSTLFLCLNGIYRPDRGTIQYNGAPVDYSKKSLAKLKEKVGIVFQNPDNQLFCADVYGEISFGPFNLGLSEQEVRKRTDAVIHELKLSSFQEKPVHLLSGGQKKQVSIADILVMSPEIIIMDEPFSSLDGESEKDVTAIINSLTDRGITVIISTHNTEFALSWADEIVVLKDGSVLCRDTPEHIFSNLELLTLSNLSRPAILKIFDALCEKGILSPELPIPRNPQILNSYIQSLTIDDGGKIYDSKKSRSDC